MSGENTAETGAAGEAAAPGGAAGRGGDVALSDERAGGDGGSTTGDATGDRAGDATGDRAGDATGDKTGDKTGDAAGENGETAESGTTERKKRPFWQELPILVVIALLLSLAVKTFFVQAFSIPSGSMQPALEKGDRVLVDKLTPWFGATPERGEVVVFRDPGGWLETAPQESGNSVVRAVTKALGVVGLMPSADEKDLIKRVIAVGGDTVECNSGSPVKVNGVPLDEPYLYPGATPCDDAPAGTVKVPEDRLWVMGDHRNDSSDSRFHVNGPDGGFVPVDNVIGRAFVVAWPVSHWAALSVPGTFDRKGLDDQHARGGGPAALEELPAPEAAALVGALPLVLLRHRRR
ncbi:signal peptidase I [Kitasatospora sp. NPDC127111]|uniref:signal peptidase I n=1 Tax=Kitasatospora sp. NPDC127111 TaxID=3345363 RepID=UPI0036289F1A